MCVRVCVCVMERMDPYRRRWHPFLRQAGWREGGPRRTTFWLFRWDETTCASHIASQRKPSLPPSLRCADGARPRRRRQNRKHIHTHTHTAFSPGDIPDNLLVIALVSPPRPVVVGLSNRGGCGGCGDGACRSLVIFLCAVLFG